MRTLVETGRTLWRVARASGIGLTAGLATFGFDAAMAASQLLSPGMTILLPATTVATEPDLAGPSVTYKWPFSILSPAGANVCTGWLEQMLVHASATHYFHFYYRIIKTSGIGAINRLTPTGFGLVTLAVAYRHDLALGVRPLVASRGLLGDDVGFEFDALSCAKQQGSAWALVKPHADQAYCHPCVPTYLRATTGESTYLKTWGAR